MDTPKWLNELRPILRKKIREAVNETNDHLVIGEDELFPWVGDDCYDIMADAAICVLRGMADSEKYMVENGLLPESALPSYSPNPPTTTLA